MKCTVAKESQEEFQDERSAYAPLISEPAPYTQCKMLDVPGAKHAFRATFPSFPFFPPPLPVSHVFPLSLSCPPPLFWSLLHTTISILLSCLVPSCLPLLALHAVSYCLTASGTCSLPPGIVHQKQQAYPRLLWRESCPFHS